MIFKTVTPFRSILPPPLLYNSLLPYDAVQDSHNRSKWYEQNYIGQLQEVPEYCVPLSGSHSYCAIQTQYDFW